MKSIFSEASKEDDLSPQSATTSLSPISPFAFLYLSNLPSYSGFSVAADLFSQQTVIQAKKVISCRCSKTKCLKLYCDCFAEGKYCSDCDCKDCFNNIEHKEVCDLVVFKTKAKNPRAFKCDKEKNYKVCHCTKSFCMKKYCECFQQNRVCNSNCKCKGCKNLPVTEESPK